MAGSKPAHLLMVGGKSPRQRVWEALRQHRDGLSVYQLARKSGVDDASVLGCLRCLIAGGYVARKGRSYATAVYPLLRDIGVEAPRLNRDGSPSTHGHGVEAMWRSLRIIGEVDAHELATNAGASGVAISINAAVSYLGWLRRAGYLVCVAEGSPGKYARYRLAPGKNTGPRPPMIQRIGQVFDPNLGEVVFRQEPEVDL
ncbi:MAG: helix-turn-helix domain-containing protein [Pseudomonas sp.]|nr:helix-turn-helix domain-containing protein [Pseudomonas sp.]